MVVVRDRSWKVTWCNEAFAKRCGASPESLRGTDLYAIFPLAAAEDRMRRIQPVLDRGEVVRYVSIFNNRRCITTALPLERESFGYEGIFIAIAPAFDRDEGRGLPVAPFPTLVCGLEKLSRSELGVAYLFACQMDPGQIGDRLKRSRHTIDDHIKAIHRKLNVSRQVELATMLANTGIADFTEAEWCALTGVAIPNPSTTHAPRARATGARA